MIQQLVLEPQENLPDNLECWRTTRYATDLRTKAGKMDWVSSLENSVDYYLLELLSNVPFRTKCLSQGPVGRLRR